MKKFTTRFYNSLIIKNNKIIKGGPIDRIKDEVRWFAESKKFIPNNTPNIYNVELDSKTHRGTYSMEKIKGTNLFVWIKKQKNKRMVIETFRKLMNFYQTKVHQTSSKIKIDDIESMYYKKPLKAINFYSDYQNGNYDFYTINSKSVAHPQKILRKLYKELRPKLINTKYCFIHGDTTFSNTIISKENTFYLIDPRGRFGKTKCYGDPRYDFAKTYFSIIGNYDSFNVGDFGIKVGKDNKYSYNIGTIPFASELEKIFFREIKDDRRVIKFIHATIWLSFMPHLKNDRKQMLFSFLHGTKLISQLD